MRRSALIFLASILLPSLGLAWLAIRSVRDQQVVLEHQEVIITQNITDALAKNIQAQMDQVRKDFVQTTEQLLGTSSSPVALADGFNAKIRAAWPMAEIGFAVNLDGQIYSPKAFEGPAAKTFRDENDRFLSNRENAEVYAMNYGNASMNTFNAQKTNLQYEYLKTRQLDEAQAARSVATGGAISMPQTQSDRDQSANRRLDEPKSSAEKDIAVAKKAKMSPGTGYTTGEQATDTLTQVAAPVMKPSAPASVPQSKVLQEEKQAESESPAGGLRVPDATRAKNEMMDSSGSAPATSTPPQSMPMPAAAPESAATATAATPPPQLFFDKTKRAEGSAHATTLTGNPQIVMNAPAKMASDAAVPQDNAQTIPQSPPAETNLISRLNGNNGSNIRNVTPQQMLAKQTQAATISNTVPEDSDFRRVIGSETSGGLARFLENKLRLLVWSHPATEARIVFGAQLDQGKLVEALKSSFALPELDQTGGSLAKSNYCVAILDDTGHPVAVSVPGFSGDWKHPFVATEIGEALPHWEAALYLLTPNRISQAARTLQFTLGLIVLLLVAAIVAGGSLIAVDVRRQVRLAQQKTDFVSNVSHELKTPLTSIRMFADLLAEKRVPDEERQATYLRIIAAEASRLTRLINNVLDFARIEKGKTTGEKRDCDLVDAVRDVADTCSPHLEAAGVLFQLEVETEKLPIHGDRDALAQIILNLISNAEKYGGNDVLVRVRRQDVATRALGCVDVLDRGAGIPPQDVKTIFEPFHRLDDSLSSGIPGSGLGLTLARRMARSHDGDVTYSARAGGGSCFTLTVPLV